MCALVRKVRDILSDKMYTVADISKITGYNRTTVTRWINKQKIKNASMQGNAPLYDAQVLHKFKKAHESKAKSESKPNKEEALIKEKDARIDALNAEVELLKSQLTIKDDQIKTLTEVTKQAQALNLADKDPERVKLLKGNGDADSKTIDAEEDARTDAHAQEEHAEDQKKIDDLQHKLDEMENRGFWKRLFNK